LSTDPDNPVLLSGTSWRPASEYNVSAISP
jgi:hypothetical protein